MSLLSYNEWFVRLPWQERIEFNLQNFPLKSMCYIFCITVANIIIRFFLERYIFEPVGRYFGLTHRRLEMPQNPILEKAFSANKNIDHKEIRGLAKQLDWSERKIQIWIRRRTYRDKFSVLKKFTESGWKCTYHLTTILFGFYTLSDEPCLWDSGECVKEYTKHELTSKFWWYYMLGFGYYFSQIFTHFKDTRRKDFLHLFVHHIVTITLLGGSFSFNLHRVGSLVMLIHDLADVFVEFAKMTKYAKKHQLTNAIFIVFLVVWTVTRLILYPYRIIYSISRVPLDPPIPGYSFFVCLLYVLQILHLYWTWTIFKVAIDICTTKSENVKDRRSDSEDFECSENINQRNHLHHQNEENSLRLRRKI